MAVKTDIASIIAKSAKKYSIESGSIADIAAKTKWLSTGNIAVDHIIGGGLPMGRSVELYGPPSSGKTTLALMTAGILQKVIQSGGDPDRDIAGDDFILYLDYEHALDPTYVKQLGLDIEDDSTILVVQPDTLEDGVNFAIELIETGKVRMLVIDSVASMLPSAKAEAEIGKSLPAVVAKLLSDMGSKMNPILTNNNCTAVYLNHIAELMEMNRRPGLPVRTTTPGGRALKYYASVRVEFKAIGMEKTKSKDPITLEEKEVVTATDILAKITKNKVGRPNAEAKIRVRYGYGFDNFYTTHQILCARKIIAAAGGGYFYFHKLQDQGLAPEWMNREAKLTLGEHRPYIHGKDALAQAAVDHPEWADQLVELAKATLEEEKLGSVVEELVVDEDTGEVLSE